VTTTTGLVSGTRDQTAPSHFSRVAALSSLLLGLVLVALLPAVTTAAFYVGVLTAASAVVALASGYVLWSRATLVARAVVALAAGGTLAVELLHVLKGLPGASDLGGRMPWESTAVGGLAGVVLVFLFVDALRRSPDRAPDHPYAL
jgi:hypothetical protein